MRLVKSNGNRWYWTPILNTEWSCSQSDFVKIAEGCGVAGFSLQDPKDAESVLRKALEHDGPALVEAVVDPNVPPLPGNIKAKQALHFAEALAKGEKDPSAIMKTIAVDKIKEVI